VELVAAEAVRRWKALTAAEQRKVRSVSWMVFQQHLPSVEGGIEQKLA